MAQHQDVSVMLRLWRDDFTSPVTIKLLLNVLVQTISYMNPGESAVVYLDQTLHAIAKRIQWLLRHEYDQNKAAVMLGALHIKIVVLR